MPDQTILDLARPNPEARRGDDVIIPADEADIALFVQDALVAGRHPLADEFIAGGLGVAPIFEEHHRIGALYRDLPGFTGFQRISRGIDNRDGMAGDRPADGARFRDADRTAR